MRASRVIGAEDDIQCRKALLPPNTVGDLVDFAIKREQFTNLKLWGRNKNRRQGQAYEFHRVRD